MDPTTHCPLCGKPWESETEEICPQDHDANELVAAWRRLQDGQARKFSELLDRFEEVVTLKLGKNELN